MKARVRAACMLFVIFVVTALLAPTCLAQTDPPTWTDLRDQGQSALQGGDAGEAMRLFREAERLAPDKVGVQIGIALAAAALGRMDEGLKALDRAAELDPAVREDATWKDLRQRLSQPVAAPVGSSVPAALAELDRQIAEIGPEHPADADALRTIRDRLAKDAKGEAMGTLDRRRVEQQAEAAGKADPASAESAQAISRFLASSDALMYRHPDQWRFLALRAQVALQGYRLDEAWTTGRVLAAQGAESAEGEDQVLDAVLALQEVGLDNWSRSKAVDAARRKLASDLLRQAREGVGALERTTQEVYVGTNRLFAYETPTVSIARLQAVAGDIAGAMQTAASIGDARYKASAYCKVASAQAQAGDVEGAKATAEVIADAWQRSDASREIARAQAEAGDVEGAKATAAGVVGFPVVRGLVAIAVEQTKAGDAAGAMLTASEITDPFERILALCGIGAAQAKAGDLAEARVTLGDALKTAEGISDTTSRERSLHDIAVTQAKTGDFMAAKQTAAIIKLQERNASALSGIATEQAKSRDFQGAKLTAAGIADASARQDSFIAIAAEQVNTGWIFLAEGTLEHDVAGTDELLSRYTSCFWKIVLSARRDFSGRPLEEDLTGARAMLGKLDLLHETYAKHPDEMIDFGKAQLDMGHFSGARASLRNAVPKVQKLRDPLYRVSPLVEIAKLQAAAGDAEAAKSTFDMARRNAAAIDNHDYRTESLGRITNAEAEAVTALQAHAAIQAADNARSIMRSGDVARAVAMARGAQTPEARAMALLTVADELLADDTKEGTR